MKRLLLISAGILVAGGVAAAPAVAGLNDNPSFSHQIPVRVPSQAHLPTLVDDHASHPQPLPSPEQTQHPLLPMVAGHAEPRDDRDSSSFSAEPELGDDHGGRNRHSEPGDDHGDSGLSGHGGSGVSGRGGGDDAGLDG